MLMVRVEGVPDHGGKGIRASIRGHAVERVAVHFVRVIGVDTRHSSIGRLARVVGRHASPRNAAGRGEGGSLGRHGFPAGK